MTRTETTIIAQHQFPATRNFVGLNKPGRFEGVVKHLEIEGEIPEVLQGTLFRCGPDPAFAPREGDDVFINGDGMVWAFEFKPEGVHLRSRFVETDRHQAENAAGRRLFGQYRDPYSDDPSVAGIDRTTANTSIIWHGHRLFAIKEDGLPHELHPRTLQTLGKSDFGGALKSRTSTAHPKMDPITDQWVSFGYNAGGEFDPHISIATADGDCVLVNERWVTPPYQSMIHDWAVTENWVIVPVMPLASSEERAKAGRPRFAWDEDLATHFMVMDRAGQREPMVYQAPAMWFFHTLNAYEEGSLLHFDVCLAETAPMPDKHGVPAKKENAKQILTRITIDISDPEAPVDFRTLLAHIHVDFPEIDPRFHTRPYRHGFLAARDAAKPVNADIEVGVWFNSLIHLDVERGTTRTWYAGDDTNVQEPVFIPRDAQAEEGDGFLVTVLNRFPRGTSELVILDTADIEAGPVATIHIPLHIRPTFHGLWVSDPELEQYIEPEGVQA